MPRRYIHSTTIGGATGDADAVELRVLVERTVSLGMSAQHLEDELARRTGFEDAVRKWFRLKETPNGMVRKIILNCAKQIVSSLPT